MYRICSVCGPILMILFLLYKALSWWKKLKNYILLLILSLLSLSSYLEIVLFNKYVVFSSFFCRDAEKRSPDHENYDPRTLYIPESFLNSQTPVCCYFFYLSIFILMCMFLSFYLCDQLDKISLMNKISFQEVSISFRNYAKLIKYIYDLEL